MKYRSKPVVIEAIQLRDANLSELRTFMGAKFAEVDTGGADGVITIPTLEGDMKAKPGDWIIKGTEGEFYPCKASVFATKYEPEGNT